VTEEVNEIIASLNVNKVLVALLETVGEIAVPSLTFLEAANSDKGLVIEYDEDLSSFIFKLGEK
jgi:hypothetical protein